MDGSVDISAGNAGARPAASGAALPSCDHLAVQGDGEMPGVASFRGSGRPPVLDRPLQHPGPQTPASPRAGVATGALAEGGRAQRGYLDTPIGTSSQKVYRGTTQQGEELHRRKLRTKQIVKVYISLQECGRKRQARALFGCGRWFRKRRLPCGTLELKPLPCDSVFCPTCADRRSKRLQREILRKANKPGRSYWLLTLTVPNEPDLTRRFVSKLVGWFAELRESEEWRVIPLPHDEVGEITGGVYSVEATFNRERQDWHPHLHVLIEAPRFLPRPWIFAVRARWEQITEGAKVVHLARVYGVTKEGKKLRRKLNMRGIRELVKYATKCADFADSPERVDEFLKAFKGVRRVQSFGSFFGVEKDAKREPGEDDCRLVGCICGKCTASDFRNEPGLVHISETILLPDGRRQLRFDFVQELRYAEEHPPPGEDLVLEPDVLVEGEQLDMSFSGGLSVGVPALPSLFSVESSAA